jgi:GlpG protein
LRQIGSLPKNLEPRIFSDHLLSLGIKSRIEDRPEGWVVWVYDENQLTRAGDELKAYLAAPGDPRYAASGRAAQEARRAEERLDKEYRKNVRDVAAQWGPPTFRQRPLTMTLVVICVIVFILQGWPGLGIDIRDKLMFLSVETAESQMRPDGLADIRHGQVWRLITPIFLHFGLIHIVFNMSMLVSLGTIIELRRSWRVLAVLVLITAVASDYGQYLHMSRQEHWFPAFGGMSGVVYGLFGYIWMKGRNEPELGMILHPNTINIMLFWLVLCMTGVMGPIANAAHVVGLASGVLLGLGRL